MSIRYCSSRLEHPRLRKAMKWGGAAATVLLAAAWILSGWWWGGYASRVVEGLGVGASVDAGSVIVTFFNPAERPSNTLGIRCGEHAPRFLLWFDHWTAPSGYRSFSIPLWYIAVVMLVGTATAWHRDSLARRRARANHCPNCDYDRTGLAPGASCPECGTAPSSSQAEPPTRPRTATDIPRTRC
jgi:hypothetical protein